MNPWFRLYTEFSSDPKIQILAFEDQRHFVMLLCLKGNGVLDAESPSDQYRERLIAKALGLDPATAAEAKRRLMEGGLIDETWQPRKWESRQFVSDSSADRVRKFRAKQALTKASVTVTAVKRPSNAIDSESDSDTDSDTDSEKKQKRKISVPSEPHSAAKPPEDAQTVFDHWKRVWDHPRAAMDAKRLTAIKRALTQYSVETLCESISGYRNSPHHTGQNDRQTVYDDLGLFLRDASHIDAGLRFAGKPQALTSELANHNVAVLSNWRPPEMRNDAERLPTFSGDDGRIGRDVQSSVLTAARGYVLGGAKGPAD